MRGSFSNIPKPKKFLPMGANAVKLKMVAAKMQEGISAHNAGNLDRAQSIYEEILSIDARNFDALQLLATLAAQSGKFERAVELFSQALKINDKNAYVLNNFANALQEVGLVQKALESFDKAIAANPKYAEAHSNRGNILQKLGRLEEAIASYDFAIEMRSDYAEAYFNRGNALRGMKKYEAATSSYAQAIAVFPVYAEAYFNRGIALFNLCRFEEAVDSYEQCIAIRPNDAEAFCDLGNALLRLERLDEAIASYSQAILLRAEYPEAFNNRGIAYSLGKNFSQAIESYDQAIRLRPDYAEAYSNRGVSLKDLKQLEDAVVSYDRAIALSPKYTEAYSNRGTALFQLARLDAAIASYDEAISINPNYADAHWNKSLVLLTQGNLRLGWELYEWRWAKEKMESNIRAFDKPLWLGLEDLNGKTVLIHAEQGLGDSLQFCRYVELVKMRGAIVLVEVHQPLVELFRGLNGVDEVIERGHPLPAFDYHCPMLSLPLAFKTDINNIPDSSPYLSSSSIKREEFSRKLGVKNNMRIGLVWSGSTIHPNDSNRSFRLADLIGVLPEGYEYICLQKEVRDIDLPMLTQSQIRTFSSDLFSFTDTAALCELMDIVISVDTSVAHLAGALGKETWLLLPSLPDWRWMLDRPDTPWYPSMRLYRQGVDKDWAPVLAKVSEDLKGVDLHRNGRRAI